MYSGKGDITKCPVCRQDVRGESFSDSFDQNNHQNEEEINLLNDRNQVTYGTTQNEEENLMLDQWLI